MSFASFGERPAPGLAAGMLTVTLLFTAVVALPRTFLIEDEQGTIDLLRLTCDPSAAFAGKLAYCLASGTLASWLIAGLFVTMTGVDVARPGLFWGGVTLLACGLAAGVSLCGAIVVGASNRWILAAAVAAPLLLPETFLGVGALRAGLGGGSAPVGIQAIAALTGWAVTLVAAGPVLVGQVWGLEGGRRSRTE
jgi:heme exporter protein B